MYIRRRLCVNGGEVQMEKERMSYHSPTFKIQHIKYNVIARI